MKRTKSDGGVSLTSLSYKQLEVETVLHYIIETLSVLGA
jgi:hypothetical protein